MLKSFLLAVFQSGLVVTALTMVLVMAVVRGAKKVAERRGYPTASRIIDRFGYVMCAAMLLTYLYRAATDVAFTLGLIR